MSFPCRWGVRSAEELQKPKPRPWGGGPGADGSKLGKVKPSGVLHKSDADDWEHRAVEVHRGRSDTAANANANSWEFGEGQRKRDDNKNKNCAFQGGLGRGAGRKIVQNAIFMGNVTTTKF